MSLLNDLPSAGRKILSSSSLKCCPELCRSGKGPDSVLQLPQRSQASRFALSHCCSSPLSRTHPPPIPFLFPLCSMQHSSFLSQQDAKPRLVHRPRTRHLSCPAPLAPNIWGFFCKVLGLKGHQGTGFGQQGFSWYLTETPSNPNWTASVD